MKRKLRLVLCFASALFLLALAVPRLPIYGDGLQFGFSILWLGFCLLVLAANLYALLRLGRGEPLNKPALSAEQREAIQRLQRYRARRLPTR